MTLDTPLGSTYHSCHRAKRNLHRKIQTPKVHTSWKIILATFLHYSHMLLILSIVQIKPSYRSPSLTPVQNETNGIIFPTAVQKKTKQKHTKQMYAIIFLILWYHFFKIVSLLIVFNKIHKL